MMGTTSTSPTPLAPYRASPVAGVEPVNGWHLLHADEDDGDGFTANLWIARKAGEDVVLAVSRFSSCFRPTQQRFAWLVRNNFPRPIGRPWDGEEIDMRIVAERLAA